MDYRKEEMEKYVVSRDKNLIKIKMMHIVDFLSSYYVYYRFQDLDMEAVDKIDMANYKILVALDPDADKEELITLRENVDKTLSLVV